VIKANAYGHGLLRTAEALGAADGFALLDISDAVRLREAGFRQTILLLEGVFSTDEMALLAEYDLAAVLHSPHQLAMLDAYPVVVSCRCGLRSIRDESIGFFAAGCA